MSTQPIAENQHFTGIANRSVQLSELNVGKITASSIDGKFTEFTLVGYAPTTFATAGVNVIVNLNKAPGKGQASGVTDVNLLRIPKRVSIVSVYATNNGTTITSGGAAALDVGLASTTASVSGASLGLDGTLLPAANSGVVGLGATAAAGAAVTTTETFGMIQVKTAALTAGVLKVTLTLKALPSLA